MDGNGEPGEEAWRVRLMFEFSRSNVCGIRGSQWGSEGRGEGEGHSMGISYSVKLNRGSTTRGTRNPPALDAAANFRWRSVSGVSSSLSLVSLSIVFLSRKSAAAKTHASAFVSVRRSSHFVRLSIREMRVDERKPLSRDSIPYVTSLYFSFVNLLSFCI